MNTYQSTNHPLPQPDDEPLRIREAVFASVIIVGACLSVAVAFTAIATCKAADGVWKRIRRKGGRHVPR
jgi:hypothetical protein